MTWFISWSIIFRVILSYENSWCLFRESVAELYKVEALKIAYYIYWNTNREDGVLKKVVRQARVWQENGHDVHLFFLSKSKKISSCLLDLQFERVLVRKKVDFLFAAKRLAKSILNWHPDLVYLRFDKYYPGMEILHRQCPVVLEINTNDIRQLKVNSALPVRIYHALTRDIVLRSCSGFCFLAEETASRYKRFKKPYIVLGDSINLGEIPVSEAPKNPKPRLVFAYSFDHVWNGMDKLKTLAQSNPGWVFDLVGPESAHTDSEPGNMVWHGFLEHADYEKVLCNADIGVSALALHRIGIQQNAPLKVREYLAFGLPCITAYEDTDFLEGAPFILQLPNSHSNIKSHLEQIQKFVKYWKGRRVARSEIMHLDVRDKEVVRLRFFNQVFEYQNSNNGIK